MALATIDRGRGPALLWGHGFAGSTSSGMERLLDWDRLASSARVVRWDARGHGRSPGTTDPHDYRWDVLARDAFEVADTLGIDAFVTGGVSMGAATALHAAVRAPARVRGLVLALPPTAYESRAAQAGEYLAGADLVEREGVDAYVARVQPHVLPPMLQPFAARYRFEPAIAADLYPAALRGAAESDLPPPDAVRAIESPALVLAWEDDPGHPLSTAERLAELLADVELVVARRLRDVGEWTDRVAAFVASNG